MTQESDTYKLGGRTVDLVYQDECIRLIGAGAHAGSTMIAVRHDASHKVIIVGIAGVTGTGMLIANNKVTTENIVDVLESVSEPYRHEFGIQQMDIPDIAYEINRLSCEIERDTVIIHRFCELLTRLSYYERSIQNQPLKHYNSPPIRKQYFRRGHRQSYRDKPG
jgi:hypothetical protein